MSPCDVCKLRLNCDWLSEMCRLTPREVVTQRRDLLRPSVAMLKSRWYERNKPRLQAQRRKRRPKGWQSQTCFTKQLPRTRAERREMVRQSIAALGRKTNGSLSRT